MYIQIHTIPYRECIKSNLSLLHMPRHEDQDRIVPYFQTAQELPININIKMTKDPNGKKEDVIIYQIMRPEERDSLTTGQRSSKALKEKPVHVLGHPPKKTNPSWPRTGIHIATTIELITPGSPSPSLIVKSQQRNKWRPSVRTAK